jgi:CIC family chloride channel protein
MPHPDRLSEPTAPLAAWQLSLLAVLVGVVGGIGAVVFRAMIALFHNTLFLGRVSVTYDATSHTPASPWGPFVILVPVAGALAVAFLVQHFAPEAKGHGVPEVIDAIYYNRGKIRPVVAAIKSLASALSIGSGGSVGREGPIIQIGASFGSTLGQLIRVSAWQRIVLVAAGAGSGIAATFNTPVGGVLFAVELMMHEVSARTLVPVAIATATATYVGRLFFGTHPSFVIPALEGPSFQLTSPLAFLAYVGLGLLLGAMSALFIKSIYGFEDAFARRIGGSYYRQHVLGMLLVGVLMYGAMWWWGHYYIEGVGYATVQDVLSGVRLPLYLLLTLCGLKLLATSLTLGSGASGGVFSPALFIGATLGAAYGTVVNQIPGVAVSVPAFAVAGMAGLVGGVSGAAMAAIVMIFEMTLDYNVIVPMTITVALSYGIRTVLSKGSIYTVKLRRRGHYTPDALQTNPHFVRQARELMRSDFRVEPAETPLEACGRILSEQPAPTYLFVSDAANTIAGFIPEVAALRALSLGDGRQTLGQAAARNYIVVRETDFLFDLIARMNMAGASVALVADQDSPVTAEHIKGIITREMVADAVVAAADLFSD